MLKAIAIDDEPPSLKVLENFCARTDSVELAKTFTNPKEAQYYLDSYPVDLIFLDIHMPGISGIEFYKTLEQQCMVIFTTAFSQYAVEGFNLNAVDYLLKPFTYDRFQQSVRKAEDYMNYLKHISAAYETYFFVRTDYQLFKVNFSEIEYIEAMDDYVRIYLTHQKPLVVRMTMKNILEKLPPNDFIRIHRSFIVSITGIQKISKKEIFIGGKKLPVGNSFEKEVSDRLKI